MEMRMNESDEEQDIIEVFKVFDNDTTDTSLLQS